jgi:hypothetical protein
MIKRILGAMLLSAALFSSPALAAPNVANTSQKGSLLIFPSIVVDAEDVSSTFIEVSNDETLPVQIECYYVNEKKDRVDFDFELTAKQVASWDVLSGTGTISAPPFPSGGTFSPGNPSRGELICFAVDFSVSNQIAFNHLTGTATVAHFNDPEANQPKQGFRYNAWSFAAKGGPADYTVVGVPGQILLTGNGLGTYDACPLYNIANFMPGEGNNVGSGSRLGIPPADLYTIDNDLSVVSCNQDLRQDFVLHQTKLKFTVWNANEQSFTGAYVCVDSVSSVGLDPTDETRVVNITNFIRPTLGTDNARFQVKGVASTQCPGSEDSALLGVVTSSIALGTDASLADPPEDGELGSNTQGAGLQAGFVWWDPAGSVPQAKRHK